MQRRIAEDHGKAAAQPAGGGRRPRRTGQVSGAFLVGYGLLRFTAEFFREPDGFLGLLALNMSMGQWLCVPMVGAGALMWWWAGRR